MRWADVPGYEGYYEVSDTGIVRSLDRENSVGRRIKGRELKLWINQKGYSYVVFSKGGKTQAERVHRLVLRAFVGDPEEGRDVGMHLNNDTQDNRLENLRWGTHKENQQQSVRERRQVHARKTECIRGHLLEAPNLRPNLPNRECLACCKARSYFQDMNNVSEQMLQEQSDVYYDELRSAA